MSSEQLVLASDRLSSSLGIKKDEMLSTIKAQCFKMDPDRVSNAQLAAFVTVANEMGVNPLLPGMLYAYPDGRGGIVPMMGPDAVFKKLMEHPEVESWEVEVLPPDPGVVPTHAVARIWRKGRERPLTYTAYFAEWKIQSNPNWNTRPRHMLHIRALKQAARQIIHGIPMDEDERHIAGIVNVTPPVVEGAQGGPGPGTEQPGKGVSGARAEATNPPPEAPAGNTRPAAPKRAGKVVDGEFTEGNKQATQPPPDKPAEPPTPPPAAPPVTEKAPDKTTAPAGPKTTLTAGEVIKGAILKIIAVKGLKIGAKDCVNADVEGVFKGTIYQIGGNPTDAVWGVGNTVRVDLHAQATTKANHFVPVVDSVELVTPEGSGDADGALDLA